MGTGIHLGRILPGCAIPAAFHDFAVRPVLTAQCHHLNKAFDSFTILKRPYMFPASIKPKDHDYDAALRSDRGKRKCKGSLRFCSSR
jgi:hypothetical protein